MPSTKKTKGNGARRKGDGKKPPANGKLPDVVPDYEDVHNCNADNQEHYVCLFRCPCAVCQLRCREVMAAVLADMARCEESRQKYEEAKARLPKK